MGKIKIYLTGIVLIIISILLGGCLKRNVYPQSGYISGLPTIGTVIYDYNDAFISYVRSDMEKFVGGRAALNMNDSQNDQGKQLKQIDKIVSMGIRALVVNLVNPDAAQSVVDKAKAADLPVIFFNKEPKQEVLESYEKAWYIGVDSKKAGILQGELIAKLWKTNPSWDKNHDGILSYVMLEGEPGHPDTVARTKYSIEELKKEGIQVKELAAASAMWDSVKARDMMDIWLSQFDSSIEFVIANNDEMALGALQSLGKAGYLTGDKFIPTVGVDATPAAIEKIKLGEMAGTVLNNPKGQASAIVDLAVNAANGNNVLQNTSWNMVSKTIRIPYIVITKDNTDEAEQAYSKTQ